MIKYLTAALLISTAALAEAPVIEKVNATKSGTTWRFDVTLSHPDTGWDHYADGWEVRTKDGRSLGLRVLHHPHVDEQPFTRSLTGITIPADVDTVVIYSRCNVTGWSETGTEVSLNQ